MTAIKEQYDKNIRCSEELSMHNEAFKTFKELLSNSQEKYGEKDAFRIWNNDGSIQGITYNQLYADIRGLGTALTSMGLRGKTIAVIGENRYEWSLSFLTIACGIGIVATLDKELTVEELSTLIEKGNISVIIFSKSVIGKIEEICSANPAILAICMDDIEATHTLPQLLFQGKTELAKGNSDYLRASVNGNDFSVLVFTSGTSGKAKGVMLSQYNICYDLWAAQLNLQITFDDIFLSILPVHHIYECMSGFLLPLYCGSIIYFSQGLRYVFQELHKVKPSVLVSVPLIVETIHSQLILKAKNEKFELAPAHLHEVLGGNLKRLLCGGASLNPEVAKFFRDYGICLIKGYGLSETSPSITAELVTAHKPQSVGVPLKGITVKIADPDEAGIGEITVKGPIVMMGYFNDSAATSEVLKDGWFYTGDLGYLDQDGWLFIAGRKKNIIVLKNGKKISPEEIEILLCSLEYIKEALIWGIENEKNNIVVTANILPDFERLKNDLDLEREDIAEIKKRIEEEIAAFNQQLPFYKRIEKIVLRECEFKKTTTKKIKRYKEELK